MTVVIACADLENVSLGGCLNRYLCLQFEGGGGVRGPIFSNFTMGIL